MATYKKNLRQTTLPFLSKSKSIDNGGKSLENLSPQRFLSNTSSSKLDDEYDSIEQIGSSDELRIENIPEVTSSSEAPSINDYVKNCEIEKKPIECFVKVTKCDNDVVEVSSTSASNDPVDLESQAEKTKAIHVLYEKHDEKAAANVKNVGSSGKQTAAKISKMAIQQEKKQKKLEEKRAKQLDEQKHEREALKEKARKEKQKMKMEKELARQRAKEEKQKIREELQAKKQADLEAKKALKEAERKKREDEKMQRELERQRMEEEKLKKEAARKNAFLKYFDVSKNKASKSCSENALLSRFKPFAVNSDMKLAPIFRRNSIKKDEFDSVISQQLTPSVDYFTQLKTDGPRTTPATWPWEEEDTDVVVILRGCRKARAKFLQFHTDIRPAYFGTWGKRSKYIGPRKPLAVDKDWFDYDVDSADEWEEDEIGESIESGDEDEEEEKDAFDFDPELKEDGFLVDHNYLSNDEGNTSDEEESLAERKMKQMIARTYGRRNKRQCKIKPVIYNADVEAEGFHDDMSFDPFLQQFDVILFEEFPIQFIADEKPSSAVESPKPIVASAGGCRKVCQQFPDEGMPDLIKMIHGCLKTWVVIFKRFQEFWQKKTPTGDTKHLSKRLIKSTIQKIASYTKRTDFPRCCWYVANDVLEKYNLTDLPVPNPLYEYKTAAPDSKEPPNSVANIISSPKVLPSLNTSQAQKRLTDFVQPISKKMKVMTCTPDPPESVGEPLTVPFKGLVEQADCIQMNPSGSTLVSNIEQVGDRGCSTVTTVLYQSPSTAASTVAPRRVAFTTLSSTTESSTVSRLNVPPEHDISSKSPSLSSRRVQFKTLSTENMSLKPPTSVQIL